MIKLLEFKMPAIKKLSKGTIVFIICIALISICSVILSVNKLPKEYKCIDGLVRSVNSMNYKNAIKYCDVNSPMVKHLGESAELSKLDYASLFLDMNTSDISKLKKIELVGINPDGKEENLKGTAYIKINYIANDDTEKQNYIEYNYRIIENDKKYVLAY